MHPVLTQIYEIQTPAEARAVIELGVDHVGTVLVSKETWKQAAISDTTRVVREMGALSSLIPLFSSPDAVYTVVDYYRPDIVHLCEHLTSALHRKRRWAALIELQAGIRRRFPDVRIMRSIPIAPAGFENEVPTLELARIFEPVSDLFLTDTLLVNRVPQPVDGFVGITGETCDWKTAAALVEATAIPVILAGGLSPENVYAGIMATRPAGVDSCTLTNATGVDGKPVRFKKDLQRVKTFVEESRRAQQALLKK